MHRQTLLGFEGDISACLVALRANRNFILTSQLMERFKYYRGKGLIPEIDARAFISEADRGETASGKDARAPKLPMLFNFHDEDHVLPVVNFTPSGQVINNEESPRFNELKKNYDPEVVDRMEYLLMMIQENGAATIIQGSWRGKSVRVQKARPKRDGQAKAMLLLQRMMRGAIARRRVRMAKEERAAELKRKGLKDDTKNKTYEVDFRGDEGSLGFSLRVCSEEHLMEAKKENLLGDKYSMEKPLPEVAGVKEGSKAEKETVAPGDLILEVNGKTLTLKQLKKAIKKAKAEKGGIGAIKFKFMRGLKISVGAGMALA